jgi:hypothetical protein
MLVGAVLASAAPPSSLAPASVPVVLVALVEVELQAATAIAIATRESAVFMEELHYGSYHMRASA